jgi:hypothetical protein
MCTSLPIDVKPYSSEWKALCRPTASSKHSFTETPCVNGHGNYGGFNIEESRLRSKRILARHTSTLLISETTSRMLGSAHFRPCMQLFC